VDTLIHALALTITSAQAHISLANSGFRDLSARSTFPAV